MVWSDQGLREDLELSEVSSADSQVNVRILCNQALSSAIIGRSSSGILDIQAETDARVTLSRTRDTYPGTAERVCMYTGTLRSVLAALLCTLHKQHIATDESAWQGSASAGGGPTQAGGPSSTFSHALRNLSQTHSAQLKVLIPATHCGVVIGPGGATIRSISSRCAAAISLSPQDRSRRLVEYERIATVSGTWKAVLQAVAQMLSTLITSGVPAFVANMLLPSIQIISKSASDTQQAALEEQLAQMSINAAPQGLQTTFLRQQPPQPLLTQEAAILSQQAAYLPQQSALMPQAALMQQQAALLPQQGALLPQQTTLVPVQSLQPFTLVTAQMAPGQQVVVTGLPAADLQPAVGAAGDQFIQLNFPVPDVAVGAVIGRGGLVLSHIRNTCNVRISVADRAQRDHVTQTRMVTIEGLESNVALAQQIVEDRVRAVLNLQAAIGQLL